MRGKLLSVIFVFMLFASCRNPWFQFQPVTVTNGTGGGNYAQGADVAITANTPPAGMQFANWTTASAGVTFADAASASTTFAMPGNAVTVTANFAAAGAPTYAVTVNNGTLADGAGSGNYAEGATVTITASTPPSGQQFKNWTTDSAGVTFANADNANTTFAMPPNAVTVTANFEAIPANNYLITVNNDGNGTANADAQSAAAGATITLSATPNSGYTFKNWTTASAGVTFADAESASTTFTMPPNAVTVTANFEQITYAVTAAAITITAPTKGGTPATTAESDVTGYTCGAVSWTPTDSPFLGGTAYTATVTLTANQNYAFASTLTATINGADATIANNTQAAVTLSLAFAPTSTKTAAGIAIKSQPTKLAYTHGDELELAGLEVTLTYDDTTTEEVAAANFNDKGITANPANGVSLIRTAHNGKGVAITYGGLTPLATSNLTVDKANPTVTWPTAAAITYGAALSTSALSGGSGAGSFAWTNGATIPTVTNSGYEVTFTPTDTANYNTLTQNVNITVNKANPTVTWPTAAAITYGAALSTSTLSGGSGAGTFAWTNDATIPTVNNSGYEVTFTPTDTANYNTLTANVSITVAPASSPDSPFLVTNATELGYVGKGTANPEPYRAWTVSEHYKQTANITLTGNWTPIGTDLNRFTGSYNGDGHTIRNLTVNATTQHQGMFGYIDTDGTVEKLGLIDVNINSSVATVVNVSGIAGRNNGTIQNCYVSGSFKGSNSVGGIAGSNNGTIQNCYVTGSVTTDTSGVGGIAGYSYGTIQNCVALNQNVTSTQWTTAIGRIISTSPSGSLLQNNYAWSGMTLEDGDGPKTLYGATANGRDGASITAAQAKTQGTWTIAGFTFNAADGPWAWNGAYSRPVLINETPQAWPGYLVDPAPDQAGLYRNTVPVKWDASNRVSGVSSNDIAAAVSYVNGNPEANGYTLFIDSTAALSTPPQTLSGASPLTIQGLDSERTISLSANGSLFTVSSGATLTLGNNITLQGRTANNASLVRVNAGGKLVMNAGSKITGNTASTNGGGVNVDGGTFAMNGGTISGNTASNSIGGGVFVNTNATFTMTSGTISDNVSARGGGVGMTSGSTFNMDDGTIFHNNGGNNGGGGVALYNGGTFTMNGGTISGNTISGGQGGGVALFNSVAIFRIVTGTIYGSNESDTTLRNTGNTGAAFSKVSTNTIAQRGTFSGTNGAWVSNGDLATTNDTIRVLNGVLQ